VSTVRRAISRVQVSHTVRTSKVVTLTRFDHDTRLSGPGFTAGRACARSALHYGRTPRAPVACMSVQANDTRDGITAIARERGRDFWPDNPRLPSEEQVIEIPQAFSPLHA
jgi:hypothetical protein